MPTEPEGQATTETTYIPNHEALAWRRLLSQDWMKPRIVALASAFGVTVQEAEDALFDLLTGRLLDDATGDVLDKWGALVGEDRGALGDADYRRFIQARILVNTGDSTPDELIAIWSIITGPNEHVRYMDMFPAGYHLHTVRQTPMADEVVARVRRMMDEARPAGVTHELIEALVHYMGFEGDEYALGFDEGLFAREIH